jgi:four helix bundle protein
VQSDPVRHFRQLVVWQRSMELVLLVYEITRSFPREEIYGLSAQVRRAAVSIPSNIAEGYARKSTRELVQYLGIADGSLAEVQTQLLIAEALGYCESKAIDRAMGMIDESQRMLHSMQSSLRDKIRQGSARN